MNTNGSSGGDTWGRECRGWAPPAEQREGQEEGEAPHMLLWGLLAPPEKHPEGKGCRQPPSSKQQVTSRFQECWIRSLREQRVPKGYTLPNTIPGLDPLAPPPKNRCDIPCAEFLFNFKLTNCF